MNGQATADQALGNKAKIQNKSARPARRTFAEIHARPFPLETFPLPAFIPSNPLSYLRIAYAVISELWQRPNSHSTIYHAYYSPVTRSVHVTDPTAIRACWECGFYGKGSLSRSEPEWLEREKRRLGLQNDETHKRKVAEEITRKRREERQNAKRERAREERNILEQQLRADGRLSDLAGNPLEGDSGVTIEKLSDPGVQETTINGEVRVQGLHRLMKARAHSPVRAPRQGEILEKQPNAESKTINNQEHLQLTPQEAFYLSYGLGVLAVHSEPKSDSVLLTTPELLTIFWQASIFPAHPPPSPATPLPIDSTFLLHYAVYHHFRALGWVVRPGVKFAVDFLLYARGPVFSHAEFAILVLPSYSGWTDRDNGHATSTSDAWKERGEWWWLHAANRVQAQVKKSLVLVYVDIPSPTHLQHVLGNSGQEVFQDIGALLSHYRIREFVLRRWTPNRNRG